MNLHIRIAYAVFFAFVMYKFPEHFKNIFSVFAFHPMPLAVTLKKAIKHIPPFYLLSLCFLFFSFFFLSSCSQQKNRWINRAYHSTTTRYNIYFNGNESFKEGVMAIEESHKDDYTKILPVFVYGDDNSAKSIYPQMDRTIKKSSKAVQRHSMYIKEVEYNPWIDDSYLLVAKSEFYKREYYKALQTFDYVAKDFKHEEIKHDALLWMARCHMELKDFNNASKFLDMVAEDVKATDKGIATAEKEKLKALPEKEKKKKSSNKSKKKSSAKKQPQSRATINKKDLPEHHVFPQRLRADYYGVYADFYIRQGNYKLAIPELRNCISHTKKKKRRVRLLYIMAQLYQADGNYEMATSYYTQVLKLRPPYEMEFYAQINRAMAYDINSGNSAEIKTQLMKMMKDEKNKEFFDQIYYALADIELREGHEEKGIEYLKTSAQKSISNNNQKGRSYLRLADIHFEKRQYQPAQTYYDSAVSFLNKDRDDYNTLVSKRNNLTKLVKNILIIEKEDSLQALAGLSQKERNKIIDDMIQKVIDDEEQKKAEQQQSAAFPQNQTQQQQGVTAGAEWYFYNVSTLSFGFSEFKRIWGERTLEDNWRRKNKSLAVSDVQQEDLVQLEETDTAKANLKDRNHYLKNIPLDNTKLQKSHNKTIEAYYDLGLVYRELFEDNKEAAKAFETLIQKYDTCRYVLPSYYQLYKIYTDERNYEKAEYYKNKILKEFPESEYAKIIANPDYFREIQSEKTKVEEYYKDAYRWYKQQQYAVVVTNCSASDSLFPNNYLAPKFHFLKALATGKSQDLSSFETALKEVMAKHTGHEVEAEAKKIIDLIHKKQIVEQNSIDSVAALYRFKPDTKHSCVLIFPANADANTIKNTIADFNGKFFSLETLNISSVMLDNDRQMISIKYFEDKEKAMTYYKAFKNDNEMLKNINDKGYTLFVISYENFAQFYTDKKVEDYLAFFTKNYPVN